VSTIYLSPFFDGFTSPTLGLMAARFLMDEGVDVIWAAAGESGTGMFEAVCAYSEATGRWVWSMGVDVDEYEKLEAWKDHPGMEGVPVAEWQEHVLSSIIKRIDTAAFEAIDNFVSSGEVGVVEMTIANGGLEYVSAPEVDDLASVMEQVKNDVANGSIVIELDGVEDVRYLRDVAIP
jgi:basic membrane protein A and related proteins